MKYLMIVCILLLFACHKCEVCDYYWSYTDHGTLVEGAANNRKQCGSSKKRNAYEDEIMQDATHLENTLLATPDVDSVYVSDVQCREVDE